jgi:hypothetical protein
MLVGLGGELVFRGLSLFCRRPPPPPPPPLVAGRPGRRAGAGRRPTRREPRTQRCWCREGRAPADALRGTVTDADGPPTRADAEPSEPPERAPHCPIVDDAERRPARAPRAAQHGAVERRTTTTNARKRPHRRTARRRQRPQPTADAQEERGEGGTHHRPPLRSASERGRAGPPHRPATPALPVETPGRPTANGAAVTRRDRGTGPIRGPSFVPGGLGGRGGRV